MWKLFKEALKSLKKNKVTVAGLTILVFLSSGIFTLLFDVSRSITTQYKNYRDQSRLHDLTVDLNLPSTGIAYNNGFFINSLHNADSRFFQDYNKPLNYYVQTNTSNERFVLNLRSGQSEYLNFSEFMPVVDAYKNFYIKKDELSKLFSIYSSSRVQDLVNFSLSKTDNKLTFFKDYFINLYAKEDNRIIQSKIKYTIDLIDKIVLDKEYKLGDLANYRTLEDGRIIINQLFTLFINVETKEATFDFAKGKKWDDQGIAHKIETDDLAKALNFKNFKDNRLVYEVDSVSKLISPIYQIDIQSNILEKKLNLNFAFSALKNEKLIQESNNLFHFEKNKPYKIRNSFIVKEENSLTYQRWNYESSFTGENINKWNGSYKSFMEFIIKKNNGEIPERFKNFSYWSKQNDIYLTSLNDQGDELERTLTSSISSTVEQNEIENVQLVLASSNEQPKTVDLSKYSYTGTKTIYQIENLKSLDSQIYSDITDQKIREKRFAEITEGALEITKKSIIEKTKQLVGAENIGLRKAVTVDSIRDEKNEKGESTPIRNVFNFVNVGDENFVVDGVATNVGKLFRELNNGTALTTTKATDSNFFRKKELPIYVSYLILRDAIQNVSTNSSKIILDFSFESVTLVDPKTTEVKEEPIVKVYNLSDFVNDDNNPNYNKFNNFGIGIIGNKFVFLHKNVSATGESSWRNFFVENKEELLWTHEEVLNYLVQKKWTLKTKFVDPNGWAVFDSRYSNIASLPLTFRIPNNQIVSEALSSNTINYAIEQIQNSLLSSQLVSEGLITKENVFAIGYAFKEANSDKSISNLISTGVLNTSQLTRISFNILYSLTHSPNGDHLSLIINNFLQGIKNKLLNFGTAEHQKEYLNRQIKNLFQFLKDLGVSNIASVIDPTSIISASKNPIALIDGIANLFNSFNFKEFAERIHNFYHGGEYDKITVEEGKEWRTRLSFSQILLWLFDSANENSLKQSLISIIDSFDFGEIFNFENQDSLINTIVSILPEGIRAPLVNILKSISSDSSKPYQNIIDGLKYIIQTFDLKTLIKTLESKLQLTRFVQEEQKFDFIQNKPQIETYFLQAYTLTNLDIFYGLLKSFFVIPGSSRSFKEQIIKMFNISDRGTSINLGGGTQIIFPVSDPDKVDFFDLIELISGAQNTPALTFFENSYNAVFSVNEKVGNLDKFNFNLLSTEEKNVVKNLFGWDFQNIPSAEVYKKELKDSIEIFNLFVFKNNQPNLKNNLTLGNLAKFYLDFKNTSSGNSLWNTAFDFLKSFLNYQPNTFYSYGTVFYPLVNLWKKIFDIPDISWEEKTKFANEFLQFANQKEVVDQFNSFDLIQPSSQNIALFRNTGFGISKSLANPFGMLAEFFEKENGEYKNSALRKFINDNKKFSKWIEDNQFDIVKNISYVAASDMFYSFTPDEIIRFQNHPVESRRYTVKYRGIHSVLIDNFINGVMQEEVVKNNYELFSKTTNLINSNNSFSALGISDVLTNPILRSFSPQVLLWMLSDTNNFETKPTNSANLAYFILDKIIDFETIFENTEEQTYIFLRSITPEIRNNPIIESETNSNLSFNDDFFINVKNSENYTNGAYDFFGVNLAKLVIDVVDSVTTLDTTTSSVRFNQSTAYLAKANYAYLFENKKTIYTGEIPTDPTETVRFMENLDPKFTIDVSGQKYIIIGDDITADYLYPVIDENNLQVNTKNQAIVYVNQTGFDRIRYSFSGNTVKEYLLVKSKSNMTSDIDKLQQDLEKFVDSSIDDSTNIKRVFKSTELDSLNPERAIRVSVITGIINSVNSVTTILLSILISLVAVSIIFIIKRYINNKNKVIGILLAQGYSPLQISISFTVFALFTALIGGIFGYTFGFLMQGTAIRILDSYWTLPIVTTNFSLFSFLFTLVLPFIGMSILIIIVSLFSLRYKAIDLMSGITEVKTGEIYRKYHKRFAKRKITTKFSGSLVFNSFWKLTSFGLSVIFTAVTTFFGVSTFGVFEESITKTYQNRQFNYKYDLETPTLEGGPLNSYNPEELTNALYVPIGDTSELKRYNYDYFKSGYSPIINANEANGNPDIFTPHILSQFSVNLVVDSGVSVDPWTIAYNAMPDTQKARINGIRDSLARALEETQVGVVRKDNNIIPISQDQPVNFFRYIPNPNRVIDSYFVYLTWDQAKGSYTSNRITTRAFRSEYRKFLVEGYAKIAQNPELLNDFFISFGGIFINNRDDEKYTYVSTNYQGQRINLYGYLPDSQQIKLISDSGRNLQDELNSDLHRNKDYIPLVINEVVARRFSLYEGSEIKIVPINTTDRYTKKLEAESGGQVFTDEPEQTLKVIGINPTYINFEFIIPKYSADKLTKLDKLTSNSIPFNGLLSKSKDPIQLIWSSSLYSQSGYWPATGSFDITTLDNTSKEEIFDNIFGENGLLIKVGFSKEQIVRFINPNTSESYENLIASVKSSPDAYIDKFAKIYNDTVYVPTANNLISSNIEIGFTQTISTTVQTIVTVVVVLSFIVSTIILILVSTILVSENEKNIAIWSILGYSQKEKIKMFFSIFIPFIIVAILIAIPIAMLMIQFFSLFLISTASISIPISLSFKNILITFLIILGIFIATSSLSWAKINKIKAIDLLKGK